MWDSTIHTHRGQDKVSNQPAKVSRWTQAEVSRRHAMKRRHKASEGAKTNL